jgi:DNA-binding transcriptional MerR regulator
VTGTAGLLNTGELARRTGLRTSALRFSEQLGLLRPATRVGGQRRHDPSAVQQLAVLALLQETGFALAELVQAAGTRRAAQRPIRQPARVARPERDRRPSVSTIPMGTPTGPASWRES